MRAAVLSLLYLVSALTINSQSLIPRPSPYAPAPSLVKAARFSVVAIISNGEQICTGFISKGKVITAGHCIDKGAALSARFYDGATTELKLERFVSRWPAYDYAILSSTKPISKGLSIGPQPTEGDDVWAWMMPLGWKRPILDAGSFCGTIAGHKGLDGMLYTSINAAPGASGSPILNERGEVVGILVGGFNPDVGLTGTIVVRPPSV